MLTPEEQSNLDAAAPMAVQTENSSQVPASLTLAQWALESGWGLKMPPGSNDPFGIKAVGQQPAVTADTHEFIGGREVEEPQAFRQFSSLQEAFDDHARLLSTGRPYVDAFQQYLTDRDVTAYVRAISAHYSTSPTYFLNISSMMRNSHIVAALDAARQGSST